MGWSSRMVFMSYPNSEDNSYIPFISIHIHSCIPTVHAQTRIINCFLFPTSHMILCNEVIGIHPSGKRDRFFLGPKAISASYIWYNNFLHIMKQNQPPINLYMVLPDYKITITILYFHHHLLNHIPSGSQTCQWNISNRDFPKFPSEKPSFWLWIFQPATFDSQT